MKIIRNMLCWWRVFHAIFFGVCYMCVSSLCRHCYNIRMNVNCHRIQYSNTHFPTFGFAVWRKSSLFFVTIKIYKYLLRKGVRRNFQIQFRLSGEMQNSNQRTLRLTHEFMNVSDKTRQVAEIAKKSRFCTHRFDPLIFNDTVICVCVALCVRVLCVYGSKRAERKQKPNSENSNKIPIFCINLLNKTETPSEPNDNSTNVSLIFNFI